MFSNDNAYQPKPTSFDSVRSATYISGTIGSHSGASDEDNITFGELSLSRGHVFRNFNIGYGAFGYTGVIENSNLQNDSSDQFKFHKRNFHGYGGRVSANLYTTMDNLEIRYIGVEASYTKEYGDYLAFRRLVYTVPGYYSTPDQQLYSVGGTTELIWHGEAPRAIQYGFRIYAGRTLGSYSFLHSADHQYYTNVWNYNLTYFIQIHHIFATMQFIDLFSGVRFNAGYRW